MNHVQYQHIIVIYQLKRPSFERLQLLKQLRYNSREEIYDATVKVQQMRQQRIEIRRQDERVQI